MALRNQSDLLRGPYPKLGMDQYAAGGDHYSLRNRTNLGPDGAVPPCTVRPPLARAVHLTLGVAVLGSLMGGVQLFGMIKMLGLQKADLSQRYNNDIAWYGYQVGRNERETFILHIVAYIVFEKQKSC